MMKSFRISQIILWVTFLFSSFTAIENNNEEPAYYVSMAWETTAFKQGDPLITNVAYADCEYHSTNMIANQLTTYYNAFYKSSRGTSGINRIVSWRYDTADKAEKKRRDLIAAYNQKWDLVFVEKFSVLCD